MVRTAALYEEGWRFPRLHGEQLGHAAGSRLRVILPYQMGALLESDPEGMLGENNATPDMGVRASGTAD